MNKIRELTKIAKEIKACEICKEEKTGLAVPGEGNPDAEIVFLGEAPGKQEAASGRPFIGRSGQLLRKLIREIGLKEEDVYITSPVKYLPLRGTPTRAHILHGREHLMKQLAIIQPKLIVLLGATAAKAVIDRPVAVTKEHGLLIKQGALNYFLTFHPAAGLRFPPLKKLLEKDFQILKKLVRM